MHDAARRARVGFRKFSRNLRQHYPRMSDVHSASRIHVQSKLVISGSCGTFPCVLMFLQNCTGVSRSIARSSSLRSYFDTSFNKIHI